MIYYLIVGVTEDTGVDIFAEEFSDESWARDRVIGQKLGVFLYDASSLFLVIVEGKAEGLFWAFFR